MKNRTIVSVQHFFYGYIILSVSITKSTSIMCFIIKSWRLLDLKRGPNEISFILLFYFFALPCDMFLELGYSILMLIINSFHIFSHNYNVEF